jgi:hypothetical protein
MYNLNYDFVYQDLMTDGPFEDETAEEKEEIRLFAYRRDFLGVFGIEENLVSLAEPELKNILGNKCLQENTRFQDVLNKASVIAATESLGDDKFEGLLFLYSYDFMYFTHLCIKEAFLQQTISDESLCLLENQMDSYTKSKSKSK